MATGLPAAVAAAGFALTLLILIVGPPLLPMVFGPYSLVRVGDILDLATPLILAPLAWLAFRHAAGTVPSTPMILAFLVTLAVALEGQAMHLAANAINHLVDTQGDLAGLVHDIDEVFSHYVWHAGLIGLTAVMAVRARAADAVRLTPAILALIAVGAVAFGFTYFAMVAEGETAVIGIPAAAVFGAGGLLLLRRNVLRGPAASVVVLGYVLAIGLFLVWSAMNGWELVPPSELDLIA